MVAKKLEEALTKRGLQVKIDQCKASEVPAKAAGYDLIVSTTEVTDTKGKPIVRTLSFLTGIGIDADVAKIAKLLGA
ncbi:MAG: PTS sugar transporter subunit IIB [Polyangiales bacterium]